MLIFVTLVLIALSASPSVAQTASAQGLEVQPLVAQVRRLVEAMDYLGEPFSPADKQALERAADEDDEGRALVAIQTILDKRTLAYITISPESRVSVQRGPTEATLVERGWRSFLVKVRNDAGVTAQLKAASPNALPVYARGLTPNIPGGFSLDPRPTQRITPRQVADRWLELAMFDKQPLEARLSGLPIEYRIIQLYSRDRGRREAQLGFNVGQGTQDIGYRNDVPILFNCLPSKDVTFRVADENGRPTTASFIIRDPQGRIYPAKTKRLAPDFSFHPQIYRADGEQIRLPTGVYIVEATRGPEYILQQQTLSVSGRRGMPEVWRFKLKRWINPA